ncbi:hydroxyproline O-arabinosyltransferase 1-like isoform X3 [Zingiber officinale]|uniref:hydroxyproline O-arabinosyltransferase 1-like isoform X3 n=1 Tax=Zingiber officinale TaxID=94328 RepID=UPI001C4D16C8|nr:hydroxyproline O-arabinosyltransferase 1-like isoform X3 [Zingiber officinale]
MPGSAGSCTTGSRRPEKPDPTRRWADSPGSCTPAGLIISWTRSPPSSQIPSLMEWIRYIFMAEPDHIIVKPIPNLAKFGSAAAFPFFYIEPKKYEPVLRNFYPEDKGPITNIDPIGNSPVIVDKASLRKIAPTWMNISLEMKKNPEADKAFGWVLEMYAYAVASALHGVGNSLHKDLMIQPPWDLEVGDKYIIHYTYGCDYNMKGELTYGKIGEWRFDKRLYTNKSPPKNLPLPPAGVARSVKYLDLFQMAENPDQFILREFLRNELMEDAEDIDEQRILRLYEQQQMVCQRAQF